MSGDFCSSAHFSTAGAVRATSGTATCTAGSTCRALRSGPKKVPQKVSDFHSISEYPGPLSPRLHIGIFSKVPPPQHASSRARLSETWCPIHGGRSAHDTPGYISVTRGGWNTPGPRILTGDTATYPKTISEVRSSTHRTLRTARRPCRILAQSPCTSPDVPHVTIWESSGHVSTHHT